MKHELDNGVGNAQPNAESRPMPGVGEPVWVRCKDFRTMAFRDSDGVWRSFGNGKKLEGPVEVMGEAN